VRYQLVLCATVLMSIGATTQGAEPKDNPLENFITGLKRQDPPSDSRLSISAVGTAKNGHLYLSFRLKNLSASSITMATTALPWGNAYSTIFVALTSRGRILPMGYPIDDVVVPPSVTIHSGETLTGDYDLSQMLRSEAIPADTDLVVLWRYAESFPDLGAAEFSGISGVTAVHTPKATKSADAGSSAPPH
jgi:hypothetical protein